MAACDPQAEGPARAPEPAEAVAGPEAPLYSPFVLELDGELPFDRISFKDVGMSLPVEERDFAYEELAQSLSHELMSGPVPFTSRVHFSEAITDPANHRHCEGRHVYVDLWRSTSDARWGYSLWSGCSEDDRFEWREVTASERDVVAVARHIATSLRSAVDTGCFTAHC